MLLFLKDLSRSNLFEANRETELGVRLFFFFFFLRKEKKRRLFAPWSLLVVLAIAFVIFSSSSRLLVLLPFLLSPSLTLCSLLPYSLYSFPSLLYNILPFSLLLVLALVSVLFSRSCLSHSPILFLSPFSLFILLPSPYAHVRTFEGQPEFGFLASLTMHLLHFWFWRRHLQQPVSDPKPEELESHQILKKQTTPTRVIFYLHDKK